MALQYNTGRTYSLELGPINKSLNPNTLFATKIAGFTTQKSEIVLNLILI